MRVILLFSLLFVFIFLFIFLKQKQKILVRETKEDYREKLQYYFKKMYPTNTKWMSNIITGNYRPATYYRNKKFIIFKDRKWANTESNDFYILAIPTYTVMTIRDLRRRNISLLQDMKKEMLHVASNYGLGENDLAFFFHYLPSVYHLHLHCCKKDNSYLLNTKKGCYFVDDVIKQLQINSHYWKNKTFYYSLDKSSSIYKIMCG